MEISFASSSPPSTSFNLLQGRLLSLRPPVPLPAPLGNESYTSRQLASCRALHTLRLCARSPRWKGVSFAFNLSTSMGTFCVEPLFVTHTCTTPPPLSAESGWSRDRSRRTTTIARRRRPCPPRSANPQSSSRETPSLPVRLPCQTCLPPRPVVRHGASRAPERGVLVRRWSKHGSTSRITWYAIAITAAFDRNS